MKSKRLMTMTKIAALQYVNVRAISKLTLFTLMLFAMIAAPMHLMAQKKVGQALVTLKGHTDEVNCVRFAKNGQYVVTSAHDKTAKVWQANSGKLVRTLGGASNHKGTVNNADVSPDGNYVVTSSGSGALVWSVKDGSLVTTLREQSEYGVLNSARFSPDGNSIVTGSSKQAKIWNSEGEVVMRSKRKDGLVIAVKFSPDGKYIAAGGSNKVGHIWTVDGSPVATLRGHKDWYVRDVSFSPDSKYLATAGWDGTTRVWNVQTGEELAILEESDPGIDVHCVAFAPDGQHLVTGSSDGSAKVWSSKGEIISVFKGHSDSVLAIDFSADGKYVVSGSKDKTAKVWPSGL